MRSKKSDRVGQSSKTFQVFWAPDEDAILESSSGGWGNSGSIHLHGESWTADIGEYPNVVVGCGLSSVVETGTDLSAYSISGKAAAGILRRAARKKKRIPPQLLAALQTAISMG